VQPAALAARGIGVMQQEPLVSCSKQHGERIKFLSVCMLLSSTLNAAQSGGVELGASHKPLGVEPTLVFFIKFVLGYAHKLHIYCHKLGSKSFYKMNHYLEERIS
jgi:hypothetical protein